MFQSSKTKTSTLLFMVVLDLGSVPTKAEPLTVRCLTEDTFVVGWKSPLTITYSGGETGQISVTADHVTYAVPGHQDERTTEFDGKTMIITRILGAANVSSEMPVPDALLACTSAAVPAEDKNNEDVQALSFLGCVPKVPRAPVTVLAEAMIFLTPGDDPQLPDVSVVNKRTYPDVKSALGKPLEIETFPKDCIVSSN